MLKTSSRKSALRWRRIIAEIRYQHELDRIDREWEQEREKYMNVDEHGRKSVPTEGYSRFASIAVSVFLFFMISLALFPLNKDISVYLISLFISVIVGLIIYKSTSRASRQYSEAEKAYHDKRNQIKRSDFEEDKND